MAKIPGPKDMSMGTCEHLQDAWTKEGPNGTTTIYCCPELHARPWQMVLKSKGFVKEA